MRWQFDTSIFLRCLMTLSANCFRTKNGYDEPMRAFEYFLLENFDADEAISNPCNPPKILGKATDALLTEVASRPVNTYLYNECCRKYGSGMVEKLIRCGVLRFSGVALLCDCPILLREDATALYTEIASKASALVDLLLRDITEIRNCSHGLDNAFPVELHLYHMLCGKVFDGCFFDYLSSHGVAAISRQYPSGLDYLCVIYEQCEELQKLSDGLFCSYNRFANDKCSLQSFGDAQGNRFDFYRFFRLMEQGRFSRKFKEAEMRLKNSCGIACKDALLNEVASLIWMGRCHPAAMDMLELFGYARSGAIGVPVYLPRIWNMWQKSKALLKTYGSSVWGYAAGSCGCPGDYGSPARCQSSGNCQ